MRNAGGGARDRPGKTRSFATHRFDPAVSLAMKKTPVPKNLPSGPELVRLLPADPSVVAKPSPLKLGALRQALEKIIAEEQDPATTAALERAGQKDRARREALLRRPGPSRRTLERAAREAKTDLAAKIAGLQSLVGGPRVAGRPEYHLLDRPYLIWADTDLAGSAVVPAGSWAKLVSRSEDGRPNKDVHVWFHYWWRNQRDSAAVVDVNAYAVFQGRWTYGAGSGFWWGDRWVSATVRGTLQIVEWWKSPPTTVFYQPDQSASVLGFRVDTGDFGSVGAVDQGVLFRGVDLVHRGLIVPAQQTAIFTVMLTVAAYTGEDDSLVELDFANGVFHVGSPAVLVSVV